MNAARGGILAAALESPVSIAENTIRVMKGKKTKEDAAKDVAKDVGKAGITGGIVAGGATVVVAIPLVAKAAPVVGVVGLGIFAFSSAKRIRYAIVDETDDQRLNWVHLRFHAERSDSEVSGSCYDAFAATMGWEVSLAELESGVPQETIEQTILANVWQEDDWYVAQAVGVNVASQGRTVDEALANLREALELHFEPPRATA